MTRTRRKPGMAALLALPLLFTSVTAVSPSLCSSSNTGSGGQSSNSIYMTNGQCHDNCQGYAFAITQWQNCWCSNVAPVDTTSVGDCSEHCPGYPSESCGNQQQGLFGYVALGKAPTSTQGASGSGGKSTDDGDDNDGGSGGSSAPASSFVAPTSAPPPSPSTQIVVSSAPPETVVQTQLSTSVSVYTPPSSSATPVTVVQTQQNTETQISSVAPSTILQDASTSVVTGPTTTFTPDPLVITSASAVTVSGQIVTHFVTSTSSPAPTSAQSNEMPKQTKTGLSSGAVAGATVGAMAGAALIGGLLFALWWRRRKNQQQQGDSEGAKPKRNASVLSRVGLLRSSNTSDAGGPGPTLPIIRTSGLPQDAGPESAVTVGSSQMSENRRNSRPLFSDQRLNPNALMTQTNLSRTSVSTLQDNQDYSRPLEVRNPDR